VLLALLKIFHRHRATRVLIAAHQHGEPDARAVRILELLGELSSFHVHLGVDARGAQRRRNAEIFATSRTDTAQRWEVVEEGFVDRARVIVEPARNGGIYPVL
jgi:hypothetical protein